MSNLVNVAGKASGNLKKATMAAFYWAGRSVRAVLVCYIWAIGFVVGFVAFLLSVLVTTFKGIVLMPKYAVNAGLKVAALWVAEDVILNPKPKARITKWHSLGRAEVEADSADAAHALFKQKLCEGNGHGLYGVEILGGDGSHEKPWKAGWMPLDVMAQHGLKPGDAISMEQLEGIIAQHNAQGGRVLDRTAFPRQLDPSKLN